MMFAKVSTKYIQDPDLKVNALSHGSSTKDCKLDFTGIFVRFVRLIDQLQKEYLWEKSYNARIITGIFL